MLDTKPAGRMLPAKAVHADMGYGRRTLGREIKANPDFPKPIRVRGRLYWWEVEIEAYKRTLLRRAVGTAE